jgi:excinuclease UvrABC ATPase subunit
MKLAGGIMIVKTDAEEKLFSENFVCADCGITMTKPEPRDFSFNRLSECARPATASATTSTLIRNC